MLMTSTLWKSLLVHTVTLWFWFSKTHVFVYLQKHTRIFQGLDEVMYRKGHEWSRNFRAKFTKAQESEMQVSKGSPIRRKKMDHWSIPAGLYDVHCVTVALIRCLPIGPYMVTYKVYLIGKEAEYANIIQVMNTLESSWEFESCLTSSKSCAFCATFLWFLMIRLKRSIVS